MKGTSICYIFSLLNYEKQFSYSKHETETTKIKSKIQCLQQFYNSKGERGQAKEAQEKHSLPQTILFVSATHKEPNSPYTQLLSAPLSLCIWWVSTLSAPTKYRPSIGTKETHFAFLPLQQRRQDTWTRLLALKLLLMAHFIHCIVPFYACTNSKSCLFNSTEGTTLANKLPICRI